MQIGDDYLLDESFLRHPEWWSTAACAGGRENPVTGVREARTSEFYNASSGYLDVVHAKEVCATCPHTGLHNTCLDESMAIERLLPAQTKWRSGVRGGFTPKERVQLTLEDPYYSDAPKPSAVEVVIKETHRGPNRSRAQGSNPGGGPDRGQRSGRGAEPGRVGAHR